MYRIKYSGITLVITFTNSNRAIYTQWFASTITPVFFFITPPPQKKKRKKKKRIGVLSQIWCNMFFTLCFFRCCFCECKLYLNTKKGMCSSMYSFFLSSGCNHSEPEWPGTGKHRSDGQSAETRSGWNKLPVYRTRRTPGTGGQQATSNWRYENWRLAKGYSSQKQIPDAPWFCFVWLALNNFRILYCHHMTYMDVEDLRNLG